MPRPRCRRRDVVVLSIVVATSVIAHEPQLRLIRLRLVLAVPRCQTSQPKMMTTPALPIEVRADRANGTLLSNREINGQGRRRR